MKEESSDWGERDRRDAARVAVSERDASESRMKEERSTIKSLDE
jgi:hypothetical protein